MRNSDQAIVLREYGDASRLQLEQWNVTEPGVDELQVRQTAIGVNFHDIYVRTGLYKTLALPGVPGIEGAGLVEAVGSSVNAFKIGDRIAYVDPKYGGYATRRLVSAHNAIGIPSDVSDHLAAAALVRGLTVLMLTNEVHQLKREDTILVQAAAGGVGRLLIQWAKHRGARVIGTVGTSEKAGIAKANGCDETILYRSEDFVRRVHELTSGRGVDVAYDSVGRDTFEGSLACLALRGHLVNFGQSSGPIAPFDISRLAQRSNTVSRPILFHYIADRGSFEAMCQTLFTSLQNKTLTLNETVELPLAEAAEAHRALESKKCQGSILLIP